MRIAIDLRSLMETGGKISGIENYVLNLINNLRNTQSVEFFGFYNSAKKIEMPKLPQYLEIRRTRIPNKIFNVLLKFGLIRMEHAYGDFDVLYMPDLRPFSIKKKTKLALTVHDLSPVMHPEFYSLRRRSWHLFIDYKHSFRRADIIFAVSNYTKYDLEKVFHLNGDKIKVVYPGIDHEKFHTNLDQRIFHKVKEKYNLPEKFILSISTLEPRKNITGIVSAFEKIADSGLYLVIAGRRGWLYSEILEAIQNSPKKDKIKLIGYVDEHDKQYLISLARMLCYPSFYEGFGFQPLEAMACAVPVITSARTSMPEICGDAALLVEPYHTVDLAYAIESLNSDEQLRENLIKKGLQRAQSFSFKKGAESIQNYLTGI